MFVCFRNMVIYPCQLPKCSSRLLSLALSLSLSVSISLSPSLSTLPLLFAVWVFLGVSVSSSSSSSSSSYHQWFGVWVCFGVSPLRPVVFCGAEDLLGLRCGVVRGVRLLGRRLMSSSSSSSSSSCSFLGSTVIGIGPVRNTILVTVAFLIPSCRSRGWKVSATVTSIGFVLDEIIVTVVGFRAARCEKCAQSQGFDMFWTQACRHHKNNKNNKSNKNKNKNKNNNNNNKSNNNNNSSSNNNNYYYYYYYS